MAMYAVVCWLAAGALVHERELRVAVDAAGSLAVEERHPVATEPKPKAKEPEPEVDPAPADEPKRKRPSRADVWSHINRDADAAQQPAVPPPKPEEEALPEPSKSSAAAPSPAQAAANAKSAETADDATTDDGEPATQEKEVKQKEEVDMKDDLLDDGPEPPKPAKKAKPPKRDPNLPLSREDKWSSMGAKPKAKVSKFKDDSSKHPAKTAAGLVSFYAPWEKGSKVEMLHLPKTAGTSWMRDAAPVTVEYLDTKVSQAEGCFSEFAKPGANVFALVRDPRAHVVSQYNHCSFGKQGHDWPREYMHYKGKHVKGLRDGTHMPLKFDKWLHYWKYEGQQEVAAKDMKKVLPWGYDNKHWCYNPINMQSARLTCDVVTANARLPRNAAGQAKLAAAASQSLDDLTFVGVQELYQESACIWEAKVTGTLPKYCNCENKAAWESMDQHHNDHNAHSSDASIDAEELDDVMKQKVDLLTQVDAIIFAKAFDILKKEAAFMEAKFKTKILCPERAAEVEKLISDKSKEVFPPYK